MKPKCCIDNKTLKEVGQTAEFLKIVAEENRLKILCTLKAGERCVCDIWQDLNIPQNLASHHLKILKDAGLIDSRKDGLKMIYWIKKKEMSKFNALLTNLWTYSTQ